MSNRCRAFLTALSANCSKPVRDAMRGAGVLGSPLHYTIELRDGRQIEVGGQHCAYCARTEAYSKLANILERGQSIYERATSMGPKPPPPEPRRLDLTLLADFVQWHEKRVPGYVLKEGHHASAYGAACWYASNVQAERISSLSVKTLAKMLVNGGIPGVSSGGQLFTWLEARAMLFASICRSGRPDVTWEQARREAGRRIARDLKDFWGLNQHEQ